MPTKLTDHYGEELHIGDKIVDEGGQNGVGVITKLGFGQVEADWRSHRFEGIVRDWIGVRWVRRLHIEERAEKEQR